ncbi:TIR domain-containing protein [Oceanihabitans sp.]|nr:TIR domain-containing protein [Oceanihabitans sp.]
MHDIFISYAKVDQEIARTVAEALSKEGFEVWWDIDIPTGSTFDAAIEQAVADAKCVIVLWSENSSKSEWVHVEAAEGKARNILVPILVSDTDIPFAFRRRQTADLRGWLKDKNDPSFGRILVDIRSMCSPSKQNSNDEDHQSIPQVNKPATEQSIASIRGNKNDEKSNFQKYKRIGGLILLLIVLAFPINYFISINTIKIGDSYDGGIVFQVDPSGNEVKICSKADLGFTNWFEAKTLAEEYDGDGHTDWYLPSKEELNQIYINLYPTGIGNFKDDWYWSSTDTDGKAWEQVFPEGYQQNDGGGNESMSNVRPIRRIVLKTKQIGDEYAGGIIFQLDSLGLHGKVYSEFDLGEANWEDAKALCENYTGGDYTDWYLPSKKDLNLLYTYVSETDADNFYDDWYWSSTTTNGQAWEQHFGPGYQQNDGGGNKSISSVCAIRDF